MKETAMTGKRVTKRQLQTEANRQYIMNVAQELFSRQGYEKTSMKEISTAARLPIGSLYYHFKNKEDLLLKICVDIARTPMPNLSQDTVQKAKKPYGLLFKEIDMYGDVWANAGEAFAYNVYKTFEYIYDTEHSYLSIDFYNNILNFIKVAQNMGTFDTSVSAEEATEYLFMIIRTLIYEWSQTRSHHEDVWLCGKYLPRILKTFMKEQTE